MTYISVNSSQIINSANALSNLLKNKPVDSPIYWDSFLGTTYAPKNYLYQYTTSIPVTSPSPASSYYDSWDYCIAIVAVPVIDNALAFGVAFNSTLNPYFATTYLTFNLGKNRGTTQNITINNPNPTMAVAFAVRAYYRIESYPIGGTFYESQYSPTAGFILDNLIR